MKRIITAFICIILAGSLQAQTLQASIRPGTGPHSVDIVFKPDFTSNLSYVDQALITLAIPASVSPAPTASVVVDPAINAMNPPVVYSGYTETNPAYSGYRFYTFGFTSSSTAPVSFTANTEITFATVTLTSNAANTSQVYLASLDNIGGGSSNGQGYTYIQLSSTLGGPLGQVSPDPTSGGVLFYSNAGISTTGQFETNSPFVSTNALINLPLKLSAFSGNAVNCSAALTWLTNDEVNFNHFEVEQSVDNINFKKVGSVASSGKLTGSTYSFNTAQPDGAVYYRLKLVENDNSYEYSGTTVVKTNCSGKDYFSMYPNPVSSSTPQLTLNFSANTAGKGQVMVYNSLGQNVLSTTISVNKGDNIVRINTAGLAAGTYTVKTIASDGSAIAPVQKLIKQQ
ncbi:MAG: T9SS type A sorting domain-containing protein [Bacteroidetes bacterium]|nr:T9SS type A sorting domain-containing protein [Bacteroidota bacterium]